MYVYHLYTMFSIYLSIEYGFFFVIEWFLTIIILVVQNGGDDLFLFLHLQEVVLLSVPILLLCMDGRTWKKEKD